MVHKSDQIFLTFKTFLSSSTTVDNLSSLLLVLLVFPVLQEAFVYILVECFAEFFLST